jgi:hypothetical protein
MLELHGYLESGVFVFVGFLLRFFELTDTATDTVARG